MTDTLPQQQPGGNTAHQIPDFTDFPAAIHEKYTVDGLYKDVKHSTLYSATHKQTAASVLIKSIHLDRVNSWKDLDLFITQSAILKNLEHPGIPKLFDAVDDTQNGRFHLVQEYIDAPSLKTILEDKVRLPLDLCLDIALQLCDILEALAAFSPPVVHRDIKPSNILLDRNNKVYLIDFDLATARHTENRGSTVAGTVGYMPAEQYLGKAGTAADVYAVFATVLHLVTGIDPGKMDTEDFRLKFEPHLPPGTNPRLIALFNDTLHPDADSRLTLMDAIRMRIETIRCGDIGSILQLKDLDVPIRPAGKHKPEHLQLAPTPRPYKKEHLREALGLYRYPTLIRILSRLLMIAALCYLSLLYHAIFSIVLGIPLALVIDYVINRRPENKLDKLYNALCHWKHNTATFVDIVERVTVDEDSLMQSSRKRTYIHLNHRKKDIYTAVIDFPGSIEENRNKLFLLQANENVELKKGDEVSILYDPENPQKAIIFPGPLDQYYKNTNLL